MSVTQYQTHRAAAKQIADLYVQPHNVLFVHYSCESFYDIKDGRSPRITSIAVRYMGSGQTKSFSIHQAAELKHQLGDIKAHYDSLERSMLDAFYEFVGKHLHCQWVHWNMRDSNYGFEALALRYGVLDGAPTEIPDIKKTDLAMIMSDLLGPKYVAHPKLENLLKLNDMVPRNFLNGAAEAQAFESGEYVRLHQSTLSKVDALMNLAQAAREGRLKCANGYFKQRGVSWGNAAAIVKEHPAWAIVLVLGGILTLVGGALKVAGAF